MPKVSVIIPTHNRANYLPAAIRSVLEQTFQDFELIVVDDASTDTTAAVVSSFSDSRIKFIQLDTNRGGSAARNQGILISKCDNIAFLDDDDAWTPEKLDLQVELLDRAPAEIGAVYTGYTMVDTEDERILTTRLPMSRGNILFELFKGNCVGTTSTLLIRRECFDIAGLFDETLPSFQDHDMWIRIAKHFQFDCIRKALVRYRVHQKKIWTNFDAMRTGMDRMLEKYGHSALFKRSLSYSYLLLGVECITAGDMTRSRQAFLKSIYLHPYEPRHYFNFALSFLGPNYFRRIKEAKDNLVAPLRNQLQPAEEDRG